MKKNRTGVISDRPIGCAIAQNLAKHAISVSLLMQELRYRTREEQEAFRNTYTAENLSVFTETESFLLSVASPRCIILIGDGADFTGTYLESCGSLLEQGDILIDLCDVRYTDAIQYAKRLRADGIQYISVGFAGGEYAARNGAALLPSGAYTAYETVQDLLAGIAGRTDGGFPTCPFIGPDGAGQFVKTVHDGIAYGLLEIYSEAIALVRTVLRYNAEEMQEILVEWDSAEAQSVLLWMLCDIYSRVDRETDVPMPDLALDAVRCGSTVRWLIADAVALSVPVPTLQAALNMRFLSVMKNERMAASKLLRPIPVGTVPPPERKRFLQGIQKAMYLSTLCAYAQGFALLKCASDHYAWNLDMLAITKTLQGNSFVQARVLYRIAEAFERKMNLQNLLTDPYFKHCAENNAADLRDALQRAISIGLPAPCMGSAVAYLDAYRQAALPTGAIRLAQDYMYRTGFERNDRTGVYHADWESPDRYIQGTPC